MKTEHTPPPWYLGSQHDVLHIITRPPRPSHDDLAGIADVQVIARLNACKDAENGEFIVRAVNSYADMLAALEAVTQRLAAYVAEYGFTPDDNEQPVIDAARAAIRRAKGEG